MLALHCVCIGTFKKLLHTFQFIEFQALFFNTCSFDENQNFNNSKKKKKKVGEKLLYTIGVFLLMYFETFKLSK